MGRIKKGQLDIVWFYRFFLIIIVTLGLLLLVWKYSSIEIDKKPLKADILLNLIINCDKNLEECLLIDENIFIEYKEKKYGNKDLENLCLVKEKGTKLEYDIYCLKAKIYSNEIFIAVK